MFLHFRQSLIMLLLAMGVWPVLAQTAAAGDHIVTAPELHRVVRTAAQARQENLAKVEKFFSSEPARKAFETVKLDSTKVSQALTGLSDEELARLAAQSEKIQNDVTAGLLTNQQITYILIALGTAVLILVLVAAR